MLRALVIIDTSLLKCYYVVDVAVRKKLPVVVGVKEVGMVCSK